jgi:hypothetical protein
MEPALRTSVRGPQRRSALLAELERAHSRLIEAMSRLERLTAGPFQIEASS